MILNNFVIAIAAMLAAMCLLSVRVMPIQIRVSISAPIVGLSIIYFFVGDVLGDPNFVNSLRWGLLLLFASIIINSVIMLLQSRLKKK